MQNNWERKRQVRYQLLYNVIIIFAQSKKKMAERQFSWDGCLLKSNGGVLKVDSIGLLTNVERNSICLPNCETYKSNNIERLL